MPGKIKKGRLFICGLGIDRPGDLTRRTLRTLRSCDKVYYLHGDWRRVGSFQKNLRLKLRHFDTPELLSLDSGERIQITGEEICGDLDKGRNVAFLTYGHPMLWSDGLHMLCYCEARGHKAAVVTAPSSLDSILSLLADKCEIFSKGLLLCHAERFLERRGKTAAATSCIALGPGDLIARGLFEQFCARAEGLYPKNHRVYAVKCGDGTAPAVLLQARVRDLKKMKGRISNMMSLVFPGITR